MICKRCGTKNEDGAKECSFCFIALEPEITITLPMWRKCPGCGYTISDKEKVCSYCGKAVEEENDYENIESTNDVEEEGMSSGMKIFIKILIVFTVLVLLFFASYFGIQMIEF